MRRLCCSRAAPAPAATDSPGTTRGCGLALTCWPGRMTGEQILLPGQLAAVTRDFFDELECHMSAEEKLLGSGLAPHGALARTTWWSPHTWYLLTEGPVIDLGALPTGQAVAAAVDRLLRLP
jgi:hypothetical protein